MIFKSLYFENYVSQNGQILPIYLLATILYAFVCKLEEVMSISTQIVMSSYGMNQ